MSTLAEAGEQRPNEHDQPRLLKVTVRGLLDTFDHQILFPEDWEFVIIFGPNGVGKTRFLELIRAASRMDQVELIQTPFDQLQLLFADGSILEFSKLDNDIELPISEHSGFRQE